MALFCDTKSDGKIVEKSPLRAVMCFDGNHCTSHRKEQKKVNASYKTNALLFWNHRSNVRTEDIWMNSLGLF